MKIFCIFLGGAAGSQPAQGEDCRRYGEGDDVRVNIRLLHETNQNRN